MRTYNNASLWRDSDRRDREQHDREHDPSSMQGSLNHSQHIPWTFRGKTLVLYDKWPEHVYQTGHARRALAGVKGARVGGAFAGDLDVRDDVGTRAEQMRHAVKP